MSNATATPTLIHRPLAFPSLIPEVPKPHTTPLPLRNPGEMLSRRNLEHELEDMSDEDEERFQVSHCACFSLCDAIIHVRLNCSGKLKYELVAGTSCMLSEDYLLNKRKRMM